MSRSELVPSSTGIGATTHWTPLQERAIETLVVVASTLGVRLLGVVLLVGSTGSANSPALALSVIGAVFDATLFVWAGLAVAVQFGMLRASRPWRWALVVLAAPAAALLSALPGVLSGALGGAGAANPVTWINGTVFTIVVGLGVVIAAACLSRERRSLAGGAAALLTIGSLLTLVLMWQFLDVYFTIWGAPVTVTEADGNRYLINAGAAAGSLLGAVALAIAAHRRGLIIATSVVAAIGLIVAFTVQVPQGRFIPDPPPPPAERSNNGCMGEGDPNCVGG
ncbi:hypothetical protein [Agromyces ramosus]|uniref:Integral membrane protein n=1 Tax=Agromyces ramosus TaxID=33879 RepID=A0ABU0RAC2_9MICO|nr:hypothetical protein [Agromyces ramosus]MDQ0895013.1 hypothetical protein [Agromyces ramosus]